MSARPATTMLDAAAARLEEERAAWERDRRTLERAVYQLAEAQRIGRVGSFELQPDTGEITGSAELLRIVGLPAGAGSTTFEEVFGRVRAPYRARLLGALVATAGGRGPLEELFEFEDFEGRHRWIVLRGVLDTRGERPVVIGTAQDVTDREETERALRAGEDLYRRVADTAMEGIWVIGPDGLTGYMNHRMAEILGIRAADAWGVPVHDFVEGEDRIELLRRLERRRRGVTERYELTMRRADGEKVRVLISASPLLGAKGEYLGSIGLVSDMTDRYRALAELQQSRAELAEAQRMARIGSWRVDMRTGVVEWSDEQYRIFGFEPGEVVPSTDRFLELVVPAERSRMRHVIAAGTRQPSSIDCELQLASGARRWVTVRLEPVHAPDGELLAVRGTCQDITEQHRAAVQLEQLALYDTLTGLPNRALLTDHLVRSLARTDHHRAVAVLFVDLDRFKLVNESHGHATGDRLLRQVARRLAAVLGDDHVVGRFGGDEFVVLCEDAHDDPHVDVLADQVRAALADPFPLGDDEVLVTASVGIAVGRAGDDATTLLSAADAAMYRAKDEGRDRHARFDGSIRDNARQRLALEAALRRAVHEQELHLAFQPIVDLATGRIMGAEALARWDHPDLGTVSPAEFIPLAEEVGLIEQLGRWVLEESCRALAELQAEHGRLVMGVNVSARQLLDPGFPDLVSRAMDQAGIDPEDMRLEVTESILMGDAPAFVEVLSELRALGVQLAVDDFGTGFSSLAYLQRFPVDHLKIDRSFLGRICESAEATALVEAMLVMARALGLGVVAEGVETTRQLDCLRILGCPRGQGFLFSEPLRLADLHELLAADPRW